MNRRNFIINAALGGLTVGAGGAAVWLANGTDQATLTIDAALAKIKQLKTTAVISNGQWNAAQVFTHCAQSVEYSMSGFPEHKSETFKSTVGSLAFAVFSQRGEMSHSLSEAIPGAPLLAKDTGVNEALQRLEQSLIAFENFQGPLQAHFAYGELTKREYEMAHVMHFYNHLEEMQA